MYIFIYICEYMEIKNWTDEDIRDIWDVARAISNGRYISPDNPNLVMEKLKEWKNLGSPGIFSVWFENPKFVISNDI
jgi:hypothetical protein